MYFTKQRQDLTAETNLASCLDLDFGTAVILNQPLVCFEYETLPESSHAAVNTC